MNHVKMYIYVHTPRDTGNPKLRQVAEIPHAFNLLIPFEEEQELDTVSIEGDAKAVSFIVDKLFPNESLVPGNPETVAYDV
jgi:hypothetical protein